jgi:hypothetical protein
MVHDSNATADAAGAGNGGDGGNTDMTSMRLVMLTLTARRRHHWGTGGATDNDANGGADSNEAELKQKAIAPVVPVLRMVTADLLAVTTVVTTTPTLVTVETATVPLVETGCSRPPVLLDLVTGPVVQVVLKSTTDGSDDTSSDTEGNLTTTAETAA